MIIYGASGHSKVIIDIVESRAEHTIDLIIDDNEEIKEVFGYKVEHEFREDLRNEPLVIAIGNNQVRKKIADKFNLTYSQALIHKNASVNKYIEIGVGSVVMAGAVINPSAEIGENSIINTNAVIEHDVKISNFAHISPGAIITGNVRVGEGTHIGAGAKVIPGVHIGSWVTVGAGAVILRDVPDYAVVVGNPGRIVKFNKF